jgi:hypothetical protein
MIKQEILKENLNSIGQSLGKYLDNVIKSSGLSTQVNLENIGDQIEKNGWSNVVRVLQANALYDHVLPAFKEWARHNKKTWMLNR